MASAKSQKYDEALQALHAALDALILAVINARPSEGFSETTHIQIVQAQSLSAYAAQCISHAKDLD